MLTTREESLQRQRHSARHCGRNRRMRSTVCRFNAIVVVCVISLHTHGTIGQSNLPTMAVACEKVRSISRSNSSKCSSWVRAARTTPRRRASIWPRRRRTERISAGGIAYPSASTGRPITIEGARQGGRAIDAVDEAAAAMLDKSANTCDRSTSF